MNTATGVVVSFIDFINGTLVYLVFALAFIFFLFGVFRYFFAGTNDEKRKEGRTFIMWGIIAMAVMIAVWGLVNILLVTFKLDRSTRPCLPTFAGDGHCTDSVPGGGTSSGSPFQATVQPQSVNATPSTVSNTSGTINEPVNPNNPGGQPIY